MAMTAPNDAFADAEPIVLTGGTYTSADITGVDATVEDGETALPLHGDAGEQSVWWSYSDADASVLTLDLLASTSTGPLLLQVFTGTEIDDLVLVASAAGTDVDPLPTITDLLLDPDETYWVYVVNRGTTVDATYVLTVTGTTVPPGDSQSAPYGIAGTEGTIDLDLTAATTEGGETLPTGVIATVWLTWTPDDDMAALERFRLSNPDATIAVYDDTMTLVVDADSDADVRFAPDVGAEYLIQIGVHTGDDPTTTLTWSDGTAPPEDVPAGALALDDVYGSLDVDTENATATVQSPPGSTTQTIWLRVDPTDDVTVGYTVIRTAGDGEWGLTVNDAALAETDEQTTTDDSISVTLTLTTGDEQYLQIGSTGDASFRVVWGQHPVTVTPQAPYEHLIVKVFEPDGLTLITELPRKFGADYQEVLNGVGAGSLSIQLPERLLAADAYPTLFDYRNVVKFWIGETCIGGFRIRRRRTVYVTTDEWAGYVRTFSGPTLQHMMADFIVKHDGKRRHDSGNERYYGWASIAGEWYDADDWDAVIESSSLRNPPGDWSKPVKKRAKYNQPYGWFDRGARWVYPPDGVNAHGKKYYRKRFWLRKQRHVRIGATADEKCSVFLDSEMIIDVENVETGYTTYEKVDTVLAAGWHTIAVYAAGINSVGGDGNDSALFSVMGVNSHGKVTDVIVHSNESWKAWYGPNVPCWNRAEVLRSMVNEAKARGVHAALNLTLGFTKTTDSRGKPWRDRFDDAIEIGRTCLDVQAQLSESGVFDVWVDAETMTLHAARRRGVDRSGSVTLEPGRNLLDWSVDNIDEVANDFLLQFDGGWTDYVDRASVNTYDRREAYVSLGNSKTAAAARSLMSRAALGIAGAVQRAGGTDQRSRSAEEPRGSMIAVDGARPFLDFVVGDTVKAPNEDGVLKPHRMMALTLTMDETGYLSYDPETEEVR